MDMRSSRRSGGRPGLPAARFAALTVAVALATAVASAAPAEILQVMTSRAAQACGLGHRKGRIAPGFDADILAIDGDPLADLAAIRRLHAVYAGGLEVLPALGQPG